MPKPECPSTKLHGKMPQPVIKVRASSALTNLVGSRVRVRVRVRVRDRVRG